MEVRRHLRHHEAVDDLPLLTESAVVTEVAAMDHNRTDAVLAALRTTLDEHGTDAWHRDRPATDERCEEWLGATLDAVDHLAGETPLERYLPGPRRAGAEREKLVALQERYLQPYPSLLRIVVESDVPVPFLPGQYLGVRYQGVTRVYSIASSPERDDLEFAVRRVPGGRLTSELAVDLEIGDEVTLRGPYGDFLLEAPSSRDVVLLATGTGVAPLKSMLEFLFATGRDQVRGERREIWLFLGSGWVDTLPYHETFRSYADRCENFHYVPTVSREWYLTDWDGETDYVQHALVKYIDDDALGNRTLPDALEPHRRADPPYPIDARIDPANAEVYACGLNAMVHGLVDAVESIDVPERHIQFEGYG